MVSVNLSWLQYCVLLPCVWLRNILRKWLVTTVLTLPKHFLQSQNFVRIFGNDSEAIHLRISAHFPGDQIFLSEEHLKEFIGQSFSFSENDLKYEITLAKNLLQKTSKLPISLEQFLSLKTCVWLLLVAVTLPITSTSCERSFSKMKLLKTFPRNSMTSGRLGNVDRLSAERVRAEKIDLDDFVDEFGSRHDNRRMNFHWVD